MWEGLIEVGLTMVTMVLFVAFFFGFCGIAIVGAIAGAFVCPFVDATFETCVTWGFVIGMVIQFIKAWKEMISVVILAAIGCGIGVLISSGLSEIGLSRTLAKLPILWCIMGTVFIGSSWMSASVKSFLEPTPLSECQLKHLQRLDDAGIKAGMHRCKYCAYFHFSEDYCSLHKVGCRGELGCSEYIFDKDSYRVWHRNSSDSIRPR